MTTLYVAGPMTGLPEFNYPAFHAAADELRSRGYTVLNPADNKPESNDPTWADWMRLGLGQVLQADGVALLDGWTKSKGALLEYHVADRLGLPCLHVNAWLHITDLPHPQGMG
jgi:hypothetical protein